jgi:alpha/beta superfamily hydrolase
MTDDIELTRLRALHLYDGLEESPCTGQELMIPGEAGDLEAVTSYPGECRPRTPIAVICHPHPLYGGSMANKVVHMISNAFNDMGVPTLRFNFRGVGRSRGRYEGGRGEARDLIAAAGWFREQHPEAPLWLAGFSFGAYIVMRAQGQLEPQRLLLVAPPVSLFDFDHLPPVGVPWMVIQGGQDEVVSPRAVSEWVHRQSAAPDYRWMADADHFFHGRMPRLRDTIISGWSADVAASARP